jgi:hypothetical protein
MGKPFILAVNFFSKATDFVVVKPEGRPTASVKPGQESCVRSSGTVTLSARGPSDSCVFNRYELIRYKICLIVSLCVDMRATMCRPTAACARGSRAPVHYGADPGFLHQPHTHPLPLPQFTSSSVLSTPTD